MYREYRPEEEKHDFVFVRWAHGTCESPNAIAIFVCSKCGAKADSKTLYVMDREGCHGGNNDKPS